MDFEAAGLSPLGELEGALRALSVMKKHIFELFPKHDFVNKYYITSRVGPYSWLFIKRKDRKDAKNLI